MGKCRDLMLQEMQIRGFSENTQKVYLGRMGQFVGFFMRPPDELALEDIHRYQVHLTQVEAVSWGVFNQSVAAIRFFYREAIHKEWDIKRIPYQKTGRKLPVVMSRDEVSALFGTVENLKHRALLLTVYAGGLRVSETVNLRVSDIDSQRMVVRVDQGKGRKDRYVMLSPTLLEALRAYWKATRPQPWLFPGQKPGCHLTRSAAERVFDQARDAAGIAKKVTIHSLRHSFATHLLESGTNIRVIQLLLGHRSLRSTEVYTHVAGNYLSETKSPLDTLPMKKNGPSRKG